MLSKFRVLIVFAFMFLVGLLVFPRLRIDLLPKSDEPQLAISYTLPNASPSEVEELVTAPIENILSQLPQLNKVESTSRHDGGEVRLVFDSNVDIGMKQLEVASFIRQLYASLPSYTSYPLIYRTRRDETHEAHTPILVYSVLALSDNNNLDATTRRFIQESLSDIQGIKEIRITGLQTEVLKITYDRDKLNAYSLTPQKLAKAVTDIANSFYPGSVQIPGQQRQLFIKVTPQISDLNSLKDAVIQNDGRTLKVGQIARVEIEESEPQRYFRVNGKKAINLSVYDHEGENSLEVAREVKRRMDRLSFELSGAYGIIQVYDDTEFLQHELRKNTRRIALSIAILLVILLVIYRRWKFVLIIVIAMVGSISLATILTWLCGIDIHIYSLAGITIAFTIMTDNIVIVLDSIHHNRFRNILPSMLAAASIIVVSLAIVFISTDDIHSSADFLLIISISLAASLLIVWLLMPTLYGLFFPYQHKRTHRRFSKKIVLLSSAYYWLVETIAQKRRHFVVLLILIFGLPTFLLPQRIENASWYNSIIGSAIYQERIKPYLDVALGGALRLFVIKVTEKNTYREIGKTKLVVIAQLPVGNTLGEMNYIMKATEQYLSTFKGLDTYVTNVYSGEFASVEVTFGDEYSKTGLPMELKTKLINRSTMFEGVRWNIYGVGDRYTNAAMEDIPQYRILLRGYEFGQLRLLAEKFGDYLSENNRFKNIDTDDKLNIGDRRRVEVALKIDSLSAELNNIIPSKVLTRLSTASKPLYAGSYFSLNNVLYPIVVEQEHANRFSMWQMLNTPIEIAEVKAIRVKDFASLEKRETASAIYKVDRQYHRVVSFEYFGAKLFSDNHVRGLLTRLRRELPVGYSVEALNPEFHKDGHNKHYWIVALLILSTFIICTLLFENLRQAFIITSVIPVSFVGSFLTFGLLEARFDQGGYAAFVLLAGLVANAGILMVTDVNNQEPTKEGSNRAIIKSMIMRGPTILLVTFSSACGMVPFLMEGEDEIFWFSLGAGTIGGLVFCLLAIFLALPVLMWRSNDIKVQKSI